MSTNSNDDGDGGSNGKGGGDKVVTVERVIAVEPETIFDLLADPAKHPLFDGSGSVRRPRGNTERLSLGSTFGMDMRIGVPYRITNEVVEFEEGRRIAWRHMGGHVWRYVLEPVAGGTRVTEQFDMRPAKAPFVLSLFGVPARNRKAMEQTLERLDEQVAPR